MKWLKDKAKANGISVNRLILNLIGCDPAVPKEPKDTSAKSRLLTGIPPELLEKTAEAASNCGMSVNKYIIEVIKAGAI
jgi:predicted HicB family RNase H-like nuclease